MTTDNKPYIWMYRGYPKPNPEIEYQDVFMDLFRKHFNLVFYGDLKANPNLGTKVLGAVFIIPTYKAFLEEKPLMPNVKVCMKNSYHVKN